MSDLKLTPFLLSMLDRIERNSGTLLMLAVTASGQHGKVKCDRPSVTEGAWPAEALAITEAGRAALSKLRRKAPSLARRAKKGAASFRRHKGDISSRR